MVTFKKGSSTRRWMALKPLNENCKRVQRAKELEAAEETASTIRASKITRGRRGDLLHHQVEAVDRRPGDDASSFTEDENYDWYEAKEQRAPSPPSMRSSVDEFDELFFGEVKRV